jgi:hypothetical protein
MSEDFLHYLWQYKLYKPVLFSTVEGLPLEVVHPGHPNHDAGPDFFNAKVKIDDTLWAGNVEIHLRASDWYRHNHHKDPAYNNVILHVVLEADREVEGTLGQAIPAWEIQFDSSLEEGYTSLLRNKGWIPCEGRINQLPFFDIQSSMDRMLIEKLEHKVSAILALLEASNNDWEEVFYVILARNFGFGLNGQPFEQLARQTPWKMGLRSADQPERLEALFLGQAGFLDGLVHEDPYISVLGREYQLLKKKYDLIAIPVYQWKFLRLRPVNFPTIRLVQLAALIGRNQKLFSSLLQCNSLKEVDTLLRASPSDYWNDHYRPDAVSPAASKKIGAPARQLIVINTIVPLFFAYAKLRNQPLFQQKALGWLAELPPEKNGVVTGWAKKGIGILAHSAAESQALVYLKKQYCDHRKCLACRLGHKLVAGNKG